MLFLIHCFSAKLCQRNKKKIFNILLSIYILGKYKYDNIYIIYVICIYFHLLNPKIYVSITIYQTQIYMYLFPSINPKNICIYFHLLTQRSMYLFPSIKPKGLQNDFHCIYVYIAIYQTQRYVYLFQYINQKIYRYMSIY